jgi:Ca2+-binding EF-hand superfamily protein
MVNNSTKTFLFFTLNLDLKIVFSLFDSNRDGKIAKEEINELVSFIAGDVAKQEDVTQFMQAIDTNRNYMWFCFSSSLLIIRNFSIDDGVITMDEFEVLMTKHLKMNPLGVRNLFNTFGKNRVLIDSSIVFCSRFKW